MSITYPFTNVAFFFKDETQNCIGQLAGEATPNATDGSIFFETPLRSVQKTVCVADNKDLNKTFVAVFPRIATFPDEEFTKVIKGKYIEAGGEAPVGTTPYMILRGAREQCVCIQVGIIHK